MRKDSWIIRTPIEAEKEGKKVTVDDVKSSVQFCKNWNGVVELIEEYREAGPTEVAIIRSCDMRLIRTIAKELVSLFWLCA